MKIKILLGMIFSAALMALSGCGGGGGATPPTVIKGTAMAGLFSEGTVKAFAVDPATGAKEANPRMTDILFSDSTYSVDIGSYTGPVIIEVTGKYKDEASGPSAPLVTLTTPIRASVANAAGNTNAMVTPLTELAVKKVVNGVFTKTSIEKANNDIAAAFKLADIIGTKPADAAVSGAAGDKNYGLALATISQIMKTSGDTLVNVLDGLAGEISGSTMTVTGSNRIKVAMFEFVKGENNKTDVTPQNVATVIPFNTNTPKIALMKISAVLPAGSGGTFGAIDFTFNLPTGVTVSADSTTKQVPDGVVTASGAGAVTVTGTRLQNPISLATFIAPALRIMLANADGFAGGEFLSIGCDLAPGSTVITTSLADAVAASTVTATDVKGAPITVNLTANVVIL